jgi:hypothetical protein
MARDLGLRRLRQLKGAIELLAPAGVDPGQVVRRDGGTRLDPE